jgi:superfamily II helicase
MKTNRTRSNKRRSNEKKMWYQRDMDEMETCPICKREFRIGSMFEYRGALSCWDCADELKKKRDFERAEVMDEQNHKTHMFKGLDFGDNMFGDANREILKVNIEIAKKESQRLKDYEGR